LGITPGCAVLCVWCTCRVAAAAVTLSMLSPVCVHAKSWLTQFDFAIWSLNLRHVRHVVVPRTVRRSTHASRSLFLVRHCPCVSRISYSSVSCQTARGPWSATSHEVKQVRQLSLHRLPEATLLVDGHFARTLSTAARWLLIRSKVFCGLRIQIR